ncbi:MAG: hypothetical protein ABIH37_02510 [archaeon]
MKNKKIGVKKKNKKAKSTKKPDSKAKILKITLLLCFAILILILVAYFYINSLREYTYKGVDFTTIQEGKLILYQTAVPVFNQGNMVPYNFYFRTNPRELVKMKFDNSDFELMQNTVLNFQGSFDCEGYGIIAVANLAQLHDVLEINVIRDENATCDERYLLLNLIEGEETEIQRINKNCYNIVIDECEILKGTERIMLEMFVKYNE